MCGQAASPCRPHLQRTCSHQSKNSADKPSLYAACVCQPRKRAPLANCCSGCGTFAHSSGCGGAPVMAIMLAAASEPHTLHTTWPAHDTHTTAHTGQHSRTDVRCLLLGQVSMPIAAQNPARAPTAWLAAGGPARWVLTLALPTLCTPPSPWNASAIASSAAIVRPTCAGFAPTMPGGWPKLHMTRPPGASRCRMLAHTAGCT
jgi:hypothetical protein